MYNRVREFLASTFIQRRGYRYVETGNLFTTSAEMLS